MSTDTSSALDQPTTTAPTPKPPRDKVMRIATMTKQLLDEVRTQTLDTTGLKRLRTIDTQIVGELLNDLTPDLREELQRLALPLTRHTELSDAELRLAHAQLVGWLQGFLKTAQTALSDPHAVLATDWITGQAAEDTSTPSDIPTSPNHPDQPHVDRCISTSCLPDDTAPDEDKPAIRSARQTLITAITKRIAQQRLTAAQAAAVLHLTGPRVTQLLQADIDEFTLDELVNLLPALQLTIQIAPAPAHDIGHSRQQGWP
ncbi:MAG TPA: proteasome activator [Mycobacterium sp.]|nr:proteasome activator [Mycobacterium sp.]